MGIGIWDRVKLSTYKDKGQKQEARALMEETNYYRQEKQRLIAEKQRDQQIASWGAQTAYLKKQNALLSMQNQQLSLQEKRKRLKKKLGPGTRGNTMGEISRLMNNFI